MYSTEKLLPSETKTQLGSNESVPGYEKTEKFSRTMLNALVDSTGCVSPRSQKGDQAKHHDWQCPFKRQTKARPSP